MRTVTRIPNSFSTSTNDPLFRFRSVLRTAEDDLGNTKKTRLSPRLFSVVENGGSAREGAAFSSIGGVLFLR